MFIKVCGMRNSANIEEVKRLKPDMMGFIFYPKSKRYVGENFNPEIIQSLMPEVETVGVFVNEEFEDLESFVSKFNFDYLQLHGNESPEYCHHAMEHGIDVIKAFGLHPDFDWTSLEPYTDVCKYFLFDTSTKGYGGSGQKFDWNILNSYKLSHPFILSGGIGPDDVETIKSIKHPQFAGIDINSCFEIEPGFKDTKKLELFFDGMRK
jgi:phosphoribosylanthranilate isomerase